MRIDLESYAGLIRDYLSTKISVRCFEYIYLKLFKEEKREMKDEEHAILNELFMDVEAFCEDPELMDKYDIDECELRLRCKLALEKLKLIQKNKK